MIEKRLRMAIQKSGRLNTECMDLLKAAGLRVSVHKGDLYCRVRNFPLDLLLVRDDDIPAFVEKGICELGIVGRNVLNERDDAGQDNDPVNVLEPLGFSNCKLMIAVPDQDSFSTPQDLNGKRLATSHPVQLKRYLSQNNIKADVITLNGAIEIAPRLGVADAICDLVSTGATLAANSLKPVAEVMKSEALLITNGKNLEPEKQKSLTRLTERIRGVIASQGSKYIMLNAPTDKLQQVRDLLPGSDGPTVIPLEGCTDRVAVHAVCQENVFWETMEKLKELGASAILVMPIEKMMA